MACVVSNILHCVSLISGDECVLPGDLVHVRGHDEASLIELCYKMEDASLRNVSGPTDTDRRI